MQTEMHILCFDFVGQTDIMHAEVAWLEHSWCGEGTQMVAWVTFYEANQLATMSSPLSVFSHLFMS